MAIQKNRRTLKETTESTDIETEWCNIQDIINRGAGKSLGKIKIKGKRK